jgi:hypothetical protein
MKNREKEEKEDFDKEYIWDWKKEYGKSSVDELIDEFLNSDDFEKRSKAAFVLNKKRALKKLKDTSAVEQIIKWFDFRDNEVLGDVDEHENLIAIWTLAKIKDKRAVKPLTRLLKNKPTDVIAAAAWALGEIGDKSALPALKKAMIYEGDIAGLWSSGIEPSPEFLIEECIAANINDEHAFVIIFNQIISDTIHYSTIEEALKKLGLTNEEFEKLIS